MQRILSISGLRGVIGDGLDPQFLVEFAMAIGTLADGGTVVLSRDGRSTGEMVRHAVISGLLATGCRVLDAGIATTPTCGVLVRHHNAAAGLQITASHNPIQWNGLKPFSRAGAVLNAAQGEELLRILNGKSFALVGWEKLGTVEVLDNAAAPHIERVLSLVDVAAIQSRRFKVVLDCNHGSGGVATPQLLDALGCEVTVLGGTPDGRFEHVPEPIAANLTGLCDVVKQLGADVGFAQDPDADRLAIVDETGRYIGEELTLALCADFVLATRKGPFVVNGSTSRVTADIAAKHGCPFFRSHVGEANVVTKMNEVGAVFGGEGNGGVIDPQVGFVRDSFASMAYVLNGLAGHASLKLSAWANSLPQYTIVKDKIECPRERVVEACAALRSAFGDATAQEGDGLRLDWPNRWVQVRASNTEPILRVIAEAPSSEAATTLCSHALDIVKQAVR
ncbi:MAG: phosphoglucosamine mutase [Planctomycetaceae bacterium]